MKASDVPEYLVDGTVLLNRADEPPFHIFVKDSSSAFDERVWWTIGDELPCGLDPDGDYEIIHMPTEASR